MSYGYRRDGSWVVALRYTAQPNGTLAADDRAGGIPRGVDISRARFYSYLTYSTKWESLSASERDKIKNSLPISRTGAPEPGSSGGLLECRPGLLVQRDGRSPRELQNTMNRDLFDEELELPDRTAQQRLNRLVGLGSIKAALVANAIVLLDPTALRTWSATTHGSVLSIVERFAERTPLFVLAGDVGTGKSTLAETFAQQVAVDRGINVSVLRLSLRSRGTGAVGEMTQLLGDAFDEVVTRSRNLRSGDAIVVIIDEADAIAQSRELAQMHHEDRAGVNALIRGIDAVAAERRPVLVLMCTNRLSALDPAVRRRGGG